MLAKTNFKNRVPKNSKKRKLYFFGIITSIILSSVYYYTYILNTPIIPSEYPVINIKTENNLNYDNFIDCLFELNSSDKSDNVNPIESKIKIRGSGTGWNEKSPKKGYRLELSEPISLLGMRKDDDWILLAMYSDYPRMRIKLALELWRSLLPTDPTAILPKSKFVLLYLNGEFQGLYLLAERNDRKLFKLEEAQNNINSSLIFQTKFNTDLKQYDKESWEQDWPNDYEGISIMDEILTNLTYFIISTSKSEFFHATNGIFSKFNKTNLIDFFLYNYFILHKDFWSKNYFLIRNTYPHKFFFIPWDFDESFGQFAWKKYDATENIDSEIMEKNFLFYRLISNEDFLKECKQRWIELRESIWTEENIINLLSEIYEEIKDILPIETSIWNPGSLNEKWDNNVNESIKHLFKWIKYRLEFCDTIFMLNEKEDEYT